MANRFDRIDAPSWMIQKFEKTSEGYLKGRACVTNIGVFPYVKADGTVEYELRHPDDVFDYDSVNSLKLKPVTNNHPTEMVGPQNVKDLAVGSLGDNPFNGDNIHLTIDMIITDEATIQDIMNGKRELSCGYTADLVDESGVWLGMPYTKRQKNIRYNHCSVVDSARAGEAARIKMDAADAIMVLGSAKADKDSYVKQEDKMADPINVEVKVDASEVQALLKDTNEKFDALQKQFDVLKVDMAKVEAERDTFKDNLEKANAKIAELEKARADEIAKIEANAKREKMIDAAKKAGIDVTDQMDAVAIQKAVIAKVFPKANLDGKDQVYLDARFDGALETLDAEASADAEIRKAGADVVVTDKKDDKEIVDSAKAREKMYADLKARNKKN